MIISENLTQQKLLAILETFYKKGQEKENINLVEMLEEMKQKLLIAISVKE